MYETTDLLARIDAHRVPVLVLCALAMVGNYLFFIEAYRTSLRERICTIPIFCTMFWFALVLTVTFEAVYLRQVIRYGGQELLPGATRGQWTALVLAGVVGAVVCWEAVKFVFDDTLYAASFGIANLSYPLMGVALAVRRRSMRGQTPLIWVGYLLLAVCWSAANVLFFGPAFRSPQWLALYAVCIAGGAGLLYASRRWPAPATARTAEAQLV